MRFATRLSIGILILTTVSFSYGTAVGAYRIFPFEMIKTISLFVTDHFDNSSQQVQIVEGRLVDAGNQNFDVSSFEQHIINDIPFAFDVQLNNFEILRSNYSNVKHNERLAYLNFNNGLLELYSQDNYSVIKDIGISRQHFDDGLAKLGGIKNLFYHEDALFAFVGLANSNTECAYASLLNISKKLVVIKFPCLPEYEFVNLLGLGGGVSVIAGSNNLLLAVGTPENSSEAIRGLAQEEGSPYGKTLVIPETTLAGLTNTYSIYSSGHRNPQSILGIGNQFLSVEHGPRGGDEINLIEFGKNYGWPLISIGSHYDNTYIQKTTLATLQQSQNFTDPLMAWLPSIATSTISKCPTDYANYYFPNHCVIVGSLRARSLFLLQLDRKLSRVIASEQYLLGSRIRRVHIEDNMIVIGTDYEGIQTENIFQGVVFLKLVPRS
jgi:hypothetical protein|tara:strand:- start:304 stop:1614 length:1311 start_codon:yes stop_codon:yes gene_type:complete